MSGEQIDSYIRDLFVHEDDALRGALTSAQAAGLPSIHVPPSLGKLLHILTRALGAKKVLEIGTLGGYSGIWIARALPDDGHLITLEVSTHHATIARDNFARAGVAGRVDVRVGMALDSLPNLRNEAPFDLICIDADKDNYPSYLEWAIQLARPGSLIVADNVLRGGAVINPPAGDLGAKAIHDFNKMAAEHTRLDAVILPNRDGRDGILIATVR
jgi:predicted O-methyltransferase YrrM